MKFLNTLDWHLAEKFMEKSKENQEKNLLSSKEILRVNNHETVDTFERKILLKEQQDKLALLCKSIEDMYLKYQSLRVSEEEKLADSDLQDVRISLLDELIGELKSLEVKTDEVQETIIDISYSLKQNKENKKKYKEKIQKLENKKDLFKSFLEENEKIASKIENKDANFAQEVITKQVIELSNNYMSLLSSKYELKEISFKKHILEIKISNKDLEDSKTSKEEENKKVSLALALSLCSLSSKNLSIDSLFLEKYFKTLEQDSLEVALSILSSFQNLGIVLNIISYFEDLKELIPLKVEVLSSNSGDTILDY